jgi:hypothetical protein
MKRIITMVAVLMATATFVQAQKWADLSTEQKLMKAKEFRAESQNYLKGLGLTQDQLTDMDDVNICYLTTLDRIDRYGKDDAAKKTYAKTVTKNRAAQMDAIMGPERRAKYQQWLADKIKNSPLAAALN